MIILDTDAVSNLMRPRPASSLVTHLAAIPVREQSTTTITVGEIAYGAYKSMRPDLYDRAIALLEGVKVFDFDRSAAEEYGRLRARLESGGRRLADPDLRIAAIALVRRATLITGNLKHFARVPDLVAEDWINERH